jgi:hypothetical protein
MNAGVWGRIFLWLRTNEIIFIGNLFDCMSWAPLVTELNLAYTYCVAKYEYCLSKQEEENVAASNCSASANLNELQGMWCSTLFYKLSRYLQSCRRICFFLFLDCIVKRHLKKTLVQASQCLSLQHPCAKKRVSMPHSVWRALKNLQVQTTDEQERALWARTVNFVANADVHGRVGFSFRQVGPINKCSTVALSVKFMVTFDADFYFMHFQRADSEEVTHSISSVKWSLDTSAPESHTNSEQWPAVNLYYWGWVWDVHCLGQ